MWMTTRRPLESRMIYRALYHFSPEVRIHGDVSDLTSANALSSRIVTIPKSPIVQHSPQLQNGSEPCIGTSHRAQ